MRPRQLVFGNSSQHYQGDISIAVRPVLSARTRAKKYCSIHAYISRNPRKEVAYSALGIWIQEFHDQYFGLKLLAGSVRKIGGPCRDRTYDQEIKSLLLYQLS